MAPIKLFWAFVLPAVFFITASTLFAQNESSTSQKANIFFSPRSGSFTEGSTFEIPIIINTHGKSINTIELYLKFDPKKITIVKPAGEKSIIGLWLESPSYSNKSGTMKLTGVITGGINTTSGLITTITFKAISPGDTRLLISDTSSVLANDGLGSKVDTSFDTGFYTILTLPPEGPKVFSETHPFQDEWYNNKNPVLAWEKNPKVSDFSYELDDKPFTIPDNIPETEDSRVGFENSKDGLNYFHIKSRNGKAWGGTTHFLIKIDSVPPASFKPTYEILTRKGSSDSFLISFFTTDGISGIDHYEIGTISGDEILDVSPVYVQTESPYQLPTNVSKNIRIVVRAFDRAGNVRDESTDIVTDSLISTIKNNIIFTIVLALLLLAVFTLLIHYLLGHRLLSIIQRAFTEATQKENEFRENERVIHRPLLPQNIKIEDGPSSSTNEAN